MDENARRLMRIHLDADDIFSFLTKRRRITNIPDDACVRNVIYDQFTHGICLTIWSNKFEIVPPGNLIPHLPLCVTDCEAADHDHG
jgi:hypothetical protein